MSTAAPDPRVSDFETQEQAENYDHWLRAKVQEAIDSQHPALPHDAAMARVDQLLAEKRKQRAIR
ncbi:type II toxin-antitoxin system RelB family antitoxin [Verminephrobacter eiseniae]|uniref:type II toxin-antitoxin system RelB family antitoxin n=1 Tax=Verminephrobacter eiseniae TaxID=364317 RepID=UPI002237E811|nr:stability determinant [Verminephrobacter eiseniae]MCW5238535.1 stability determinant [Verminephrobacter eiseniae]